MADSIIKEIKDKQKAKQKIEKEEKMKPLIETIKTIVITVLITLLVAFPLGVMYEKSNTDAIKREAQSISQLKQ